MIRASGLYGRAVIDLDTAERVGEVDEIIVDPYGPGVAGYVVACDGSMFRRKKRIIVPIDAFHAIGPDALKHHFHGSTGLHLRDVPRLSPLLVFADVRREEEVAGGGHSHGARDDAP